MAAGDASDADASASASAASGANVVVEQPATAAEVRDHAASLLPDFDQDDVLLLPCPPPSWHLDTLTLRNLLTSCPFLQGRLGI